MMPTDLPIASQPPAAGISLRLVRLADTAALHNRCWPDQNFAAIYRLITNVRHNMVVGRGVGAVITDNQDSPVGYGQLILWPRCGEISDLVVMPSLRCKGLGTALIQYLVRAARDMHVDCLEIGAAKSNPGAIRLYHRLGFNDSHTLTVNLGKGTEDVLYLTLPLD